MKCDERPRSCMNCARRGLSCGGYSWGPTPKLKGVQLHAQTDLTEAGLQRRRLRGSCNSCRSCKTKCSGGKPTCERCLGKGLSCIYRSRATQISSPQNPQREIVHPQLQNDARGRPFLEGREEPESNTSPEADDEITNLNDGSSDVRGTELPSWLVLSTHIRARMSVN